MVAVKSYLSLLKGFFLLGAFTLGVITAMVLWTSLESIGPPTLTVANPECVRTSTKNEKAIDLPATVPGHQKNVTEKEDPALGELLQILQARLGNYTGPKLKWNHSQCPENVTGATPCYDAACPVQFSSQTLKERLRQVMAARAPIPPKYLQALTSVAKPVTSHKYIFVTGSSSNHYKEMQLLLNTTFKDLFPRLKGEDYTFVVYNLGLSPQERNLTEKYCRCTLLDFPFAALPDYVKQLNCYVWKILIVASLLEKAEYLVWMDSSIRWRHTTPLAEIFRRAKAHGYQTRYNTGSIAVRSQPSMAHFFGAQICQYSAFTEMEGGFGIYYNDRFMREAVIQPLLGCAFNRTCMCVQDHHKLVNCANRPAKNAKRYGQCHRFDQSSLGMLFSKLFLENRPMLYVPVNSVGVERDKGANWFGSR